MGSPALRFYEKGLALYRELGDRRGVATTHYGLGFVAYEQGDHVSARLRFAESLTIKRDLGHKQGIAYGLDKFAGLAFRQHQLERAARLWGAAEAVWGQTGTAVEAIRMERHQRDAASAREKMGEAGWTAAWNQGHAMSLEQAIEDALHEEQVGTGHPVSSHRRQNA